MPSHKTWVFDPDSGGKKIPEAVKSKVRQRIEGVAEKRFKGKYTRLDIRFKGQFCYIDVYQEPAVRKGRLPKDWPETREEFYERLRNSPTHLCRLRYFGDDSWGYAFYTYSNETYQVSVFPNGEFKGKPEDAFLASAEVHLNGP